MKYIDSFYFEGCSITYMKCIDHCYIDGCGISGVKDYIIVTLKGVAE